MEKFIKVYDNILPEYLVQEFEKVAFGVGNLEWKFTDNISGQKTDKSTGYCLRLYSSRDENVKSGVTHFFSQILYYLAVHKEISIQEVYESRIFIQHPSENPGVSYEGIHNDLKNKHWVCLYYLNDSDGETVFFEDDDTTEITRIEPKRGRIAFFDGSIRHAASLPAESARGVVNFDFLGDFLNK